MSPKTLNTLVFTSIAVFSLFFGLLHAQREKTKGTVNPQRHTRRQQMPSRKTAVRPLQSTQDTLTRFQETEFYRTLVDNNLFRPLGWAPPRPRYLYRLIGTRTPTDGKSEAQAILQSTTAGRTYIVSLGEKLGTDTTAVEIQPKQVTLEKAGVRRTLHLDTTSLLK